jgi:hypothetical protein
MKEDDDLSKIQQALDSSFAAIANQLSMSTTAAPSQTQEEVCAEWMFGDAATGWLGLHAMAHLNPLRWSGSTLISKIIEDLSNIKLHGHDRPIIVKCPPGVLGKEEQFPNIEETIRFLENMKSSDIVPAPTSAAVQQPQPLADSPDTERNLR